MLGIYKTVAVLLGILSSLQAASTDRCVEEIALTGDAVNITSPGYPNHYGADLTCGWKINASSPDSRVGIHMANFNLESSADCLSFYNGPDNSSRPLFQFCGKNTDTDPRSFLSSRDSMYIQFTSDSSVNAGGFRIVVIDYEKCGGTLTATSEVANLPSPGYPYTYFNDLRCTWIITAENENETVGLTTLHSDIEGLGASCPYDVLRVYTGNTIEDDQHLGDSCLKQRPTYQSSKNSLLVHFTTDSSTTKQGFMLQYVARKAGDCNNTYAVMSTDKYIMSPGYPDIYDSNLECFIILVDVTSTSGNLKLDIVNLDVDGDFPNCGNDSVTLYRGLSGQLIRQFCGDSSITSFGPFYSNGIFMTMVFKTNGDSSGRGFRIRVSHSERKVVPPQSKDCGSQFLNTTIHPQYLQSPGYPVELSSHKDCVWTITASAPNMMVRIDVIDSDIYSTDTSYVYCRNDRVTAYDGPSIFNDTISFWCGPSRPTLQSSGSAITIQFHSTGSSGFKLAYFETNEQYHCGGTLNITTADYTTLTSPNYPGPYPNRQNCIWIIYAPPNTNIEAKVRNTKIESTTPCRYDYLEIYDGMRSSVSDPGRYCGDDNIDYISSGHIISVRFHSDSSSRYKGFQMLLKAGHFRASQTMELSASYDTAYILSPNYPFNYPSNTESSWKITAGRDYTVMIEVKESSLERSFGCLSDFVEAFDGFPNVVGCIDGTFIRVQRPTTNEGDFVNRKGYHSLNVQMCCDANFCITSCNASWPGSVHDSRIFRTSALCRQFENGQYKGFLLGDSGYPCRWFLLTPLLNPTNRAEERYNGSLCRTRVLIEQTFGVLKRRFQCLHNELRATPRQAVTYVVACVVLHNLGIERGDIINHENLMPPSSSVNNYVPTVTGQNEGADVRRHIIQTFFSR